VNQRTNWGVVPLCEGGKKPLSQRRAPKGYPVTASFKEAVLRLAGGKEVQPLSSMGRKKKEKPRREERRTCKKKRNTSLGRTSGYRGRLLYKREEGGGEKNGSTLSSYCSCARKKRGENHQTRRGGKPSRCAAGVLVRR